MEYHDNSEPAYRDYGQMANDDAAAIPAEDVDAALRRIGEALRLGDNALRIIREERERLGLPKEVKA